MKLKTSLLLLGAGLLAVLPARADRYCPPPSDEPGNFERPVVASLDTGIEMGSSMNEGSHSELSSELNPDSRQGEMGKELEAENGKDASHLKDRKHQLTDFKAVPEPEPLSLLLFGLTAIGFKGIAAKFSK